MNCIQCGKETKNPKFCSRSCAAKKNNETKQKRTKQGKCHSCKTPIYSKLKFCEKCFQKKREETTENAKCPICDCHRDSENTRKQGKNGLQGYCNACTAGRLFLYNRASKQKCVDYKGGKCQKCGYDKCNGSLDLHHRDPSEKKFAISEIVCRKFDNELKTELDKCDLLCSNCHRELHAKEKDEEYSDFLIMYNSYIESKQVGLAELESATVPL